MPKLRTVQRRSVFSLLTLTILSSACTPASVKDTAQAPPPRTVKEVKETPRVVAPIPAVAPLEKSQQELAAGIASYENGTYKLAVRQLQAALALGLDSHGDQARAHKYLAFMHCVGGRERQCREAFRKALDADPLFDLTTAESGHPTWGPVFRKVKAAGKPGTK